VTLGLAPGESVDVGVTVHEPVAEEVAENEPERV